MTPNPYRLTLIIAVGLTIGLGQASLAQNAKKELPFPHGGPMGNQCNTCHSLEPTPEEMPKGEFSGFHPAPFRVCSGCHGENPHIGAKTHSIVPTPEAKEGIEKARKERPNAFPLDAQGKITCGTCHDPHSPEWGITGPAKPLNLEKSAVPNAELIKELMGQKKGLIASKLGLSPDDPALNFEFRETETPLLWESASEGRLCLTCHTDKATMHSPTPGN